MLAGLNDVVRRACPGELQVLFAPFDVALDEHSVLQPDLLVARRSDFTARDLPTAPLLAVEVLSPSTRRVDLTLKLSRYESAGCPSYWVVDPDPPALRAWELLRTATSRWPTSPARSGTTRSGRSPSASVRFVCCPEGSGTGPSTDESSETLA